MRTVVEHIEALCYKLRMFRIPVEGLTNVFCDNEAVFKNTMIPESTLKKKHNSICYHCCREAVAARVMRVAKEGTLTNLADMFTKTLMPDPIQSNQGTSTPTRATNRFRTSSSTPPPPPPHPVSTELGEFFQSFKVLLQPSNELKIISHSNLSSATLILDKHSSTAFTTNFISHSNLSSTTLILDKHSSTASVLSQKSL